MEVPVYRASFLLVRCWPLAILTTSDPHQLANPPLPAVATGVQMFDQLPVVAVVFALLAAAIHILFFVLESVLFRRPVGWRTFGVASQADADLTRDWALNQGFYNFFLAAGVVVGVVLNRSADPATAGAGAGMVVLATCSMVAAAVVLLVSKPKMVRGVVLQGVAPLIAVVMVVLG